MRLLVIANHVAFARGGAEAHTQGLLGALQAAGHQAEALRLPFCYRPASAIESRMDAAQTLDLGPETDLGVDAVISLQFPGWGVRHPHHVAWILHQHRAAYELFDAARAAPEERELRERIHAFDRAHLGAVRHRFANSRRVAERLQRNLGLTAEPLYHPPPAAEQLAPGESWGYIFCPSRLESLKRQDLLIEAAARLREPVPILIAGNGGQRSRLQQAIHHRGLEDRVRLVGYLSEAEKRVAYAHALAVFFGPHDEDLGYVTLEAMLCAKPVITCADSGGPLEFVRHGATGWVTRPDPEAVAEAISEAAARPERTARMGREALAHYQTLNLSWPRTVRRLLAALE